MKKILYILGCLGLLLGLGACSVQKTKEVTATFYVQEQNPITRNYSQNTKLNESDFPTDTKIGYEPEKWYLDNQYQEQVVFPYTLSDNQNFYLKWTALPEVEKVSVQLVVDEKVETKELVKGTTLQPTTPAKEGHTFKGWSTQKDAYQAFDFKAVLEQDITLYAFFDINIYNVVFYNENKLHEVTTVNYNEIITEPTTPTKEGHIFKGWSTLKDSYQAFDFNQPVQEDLNLYAFYDTGQYTIEFYVNNQLFKTVKASLNQTISQPEDPVVTGYVLEGWYLESTFSTKYNFTNPIKNNLKLYAKMMNPSIPTISITYHIDEQTSTQHIEKGATLNQPTQPAKEGYTFKGWSTDKKSYAAYSFNQQVQNDLELYAFFDINQYTVTFSLQGKTYQVKTVNYLQSVDKPTDPQVTGYTFDGWYQDTSYQHEFDFASKITKSITIYAKLSPISVQQYTVTYIVQDKTYTTLKVNENTTITKPTDPVVKGYAFENWFFDKTYAQVFDFNTPITMDITLYGKMTPLAKHTVTYLVDQNSYHVEEVYHNDCATKPVDPTSSDTKLSFTGWYIGADLFDFSTPILEDVTLTAKFEEAKINVKAFSSSAEAILMEIEKVAGVPLANYHFSYKLASDTTYTTVDSKLVQELTNSVRCDIIGLTAGSYFVKVTISAAEEISINKSIEVTAYDRSGYAHFKSTTGIGAYNDDGTLKSNALVVYVTNENKNTVTASIGGKTYTGLAAILKAQSNSKVPLDIRVIGKITTNQWAPKDVAPRLADNSNLTDTFWKNEFETKYGDNLVGLTVKYMDKQKQKSYTYTTTAKGLSSAKEGSTSKKETTYNGTKYSDIKGKKVYDDDSYWNMLDVSDVSNVTIEGIGSTAEFFQWGITWSNCNSIEVRNITFTDNTEDACSFQGDDKDPTKCGRYWVHHNVFNKGKNNWDVSGERDKYAGDGSTDFKGCYGITSSYNVFNNCKKTGLVGSGNDVLTKDVTFHHNYYNQVGSRLPLGRQANMHFYNNYYYKCSTCQDIRANAFVLSENNYFDSCSNCQLVTNDNTYKNTIIKSYQDYFTGGKTQATKVTDRTQTLSGNCKPDGSTNYTNFDTNESLFYYDSANKRSNVAVLTETSDVPTYTKSHAGVLKEGYNPSAQPTTPVDPTPTPEEPTNWVEQLNETFATTQTVTKVTTDPTSAGLYYRSALTKSGVTESDGLETSMNISNGTLNINDESETDTTFGYYMFDTTYNSGKVRITLNFIPQTVNGKWTMIHFLDGNKNIGIRSNDTKLLGYSYNGTDVALLNEAYTAKTTYTIVLTIDFDNSSATISINGTTQTISGYTPTSLKGIMFQTASGSRSFSVDNLKIETA